MVETNTPNEKVTQDSRITKIVDRVITDLDVKDKSPQVKRRLSEMLKYGFDRANSPAAIAKAAHTFDNPEALIEGLKKEKTNSGFGQNTIDLVVSLALALRRAEKLQAAEIISPEEKMKKEAALASALGGVDAASGVTVEKYIEQQAGSEITTDDFLQKLAELKKKRKPTQEITEKPASPAEQVKAAKSSQELNHETVSQSVDQMLNFLGQLAKADVINPQDKYEVTVTMDDLSTVISAARLEVDEINSRFRFKESTRKVTTETKKIVSVEEKEREVKKVLETDFFQSLKQDREKIMRTAQRRSVIDAYLTAEAKISAITQAGNSPDPELLVNRDSQKQKLDEFRSDPEFDADWEHFENQVKKFYNEDSS